MAVLVAAAGSLAGGLAANAIMGKPKADSVTHVANVFQATATVGGQSMMIPQVDASGAMTLFQQAAVEQNASYQQGLAYFENASAQAKVEINQGFADQLRTLKPLSRASDQALAEMQRFMGMDPISSTDKYLSMGTDQKVNSDLLTSMGKMEQYKDATQRASGVDALKSQLGSITSGYDAQLAQLALDRTDIVNQQGGKLQALQAKYANIASRDTQIQKDIFKNDLPFNSVDLDAGKHNIYDNYGNVIGNSKYTSPDQFLQTGHVVDHSLTTGTNEYVNDGQSGGGDYQGFVSLSDDTYMADFQQAISDQQAFLNSMLAANQQSRDQLTAQKDLDNRMIGQYLTDYTPDYDRGYTGDEVEAKLEATPGYQFQMDQGLQAVQRKSAAAGMLGTGNTLMALTDYGQAQALNFYQTNLQNLANIVSMGTGATMGVAASQIAHGENLASITGQTGQAGLQTYDAIGDQKAQSLYHQGDTQIQVAEFNASLQQQTLLAKMGFQNQTANTALSSAAGIQQAQNQSNQLSYQFAQNQQAGAQFYA